MDLKELNEAMGAALAETKPLEESMGYSFSELEDQAAELFVERGLKTREEVVKALEDTDEIRLALLGELPREDLLKFYAELPIDMDEDEEIRILIETCLVKALLHEHATIENLMDIER